VISSAFMLSKKRTAAIILLLLGSIGAVGTGLAAQQAAPPPSMPELLRILRITTFRVRTQRESDFVWNIIVLPREEARPRGANPKGLTRRTALLSLREKEDGVYEFTLPESKGAYSQGDFELCKEISCAGQYDIRWLKQPAYSSDGTQCILGEFSNLGDAQPSAYVALVRVRSKL